MHARYVSSLTNKQTKWMKCQVMGNQIKEGKFEICIRSVYRYERRKEREEKTGEITSFLSILSDFQQIQVKFYQLFAKIIRWSLEIWKKKLPKLSFVWPKGKRKKIKINWNSQLSCVQDNKQTNKQISKMTPRFKRARQKKLKFQISCKSVHKQRSLER